MAGYFSMNISSALCRSTHVVLHDGLTRLFTSGNLHSSTSTSLSRLFPFSKNFHASLTLPIMFLTSTSEHELAIDKFSMWLQQCTYVARVYFCRMILLAPFLTPAILQDNQGYCISGKFTMLLLKTEKAFFHNMHIFLFIYIPKDEDNLLD